MGLHAANRLVSEKAQLGFYVVHNGHVGPRWRRNHDCREAEMPRGARPVAVTVSCVLVPAMTV